MPKKVSYNDCPKRTGKEKLDIYTKIDGNLVSVVIVGDPVGLKYLAGVIEYIADMSQEAKGLPVGERAHVHLAPDNHLGFHSCEVEICRADANGTGELPHYML